MLKPPHPHQAAQRRAMYSLHPPRGCHSHAELPSRLAILSHVLTIACRRHPVGDVDLLSGN